MTDAPTRTRVWLGRQGAAAIAVVVGTVVWRGVLIGQSFFNQDDYYLTTRALDADITWSFVFKPVAGHIQPAQQLSYWFVANHVPFDWPVVAIGILVVHVLAVVAAWHLLSRLLPARWSRVPLLAVFAWSPLTLVTTLWWSAAMGLWPGVLAGVVATLWLVRDLDGVGRRWVNLTACLLAVAFGLLWHERSILIAALLFGVAVSMSPARGVRRIRDALVRGWPLWAPMAALCLGYLVLHGLVATVGEQNATAADYVGIVWNALVRNAVPGLVSGPWQATLNGGAVIPLLWVTIVSCVIVLLGVVGLVRYGGSNAVWSLLMLLVYVVAATGMLLLGRAGFGSIIGLDPRYTSDLVAVATIFVALACRRPVHRPTSWLSRTRIPRSAIALALTGLYAVGSIFGSAALVPHFQNRDDRSYVTNLRGDFAKDPTRVVVDDQVPATILLPLLGRESLLSSVFAPLPENITFDEPTERLSRVNERGRLQSVNVDLSVAMKPGNGECGYPVARRPVRVPLANSVGGSFGATVLTRVGYYTDQEVDVRVRTTTGMDQRFRAKRGPNVVWLVIPKTKKPVDAYWFRVTGPASGTVCVANLFAGGLRK